MTQQADQQEFRAPQLSLSILHLEDNPDDALLCRRILRKAQWDVQVDVVATPIEFRERLKAGRYDVILSDYNLGTWTGMDAFNMLRQEGYDHPFILVTGALGDQKAVECVHNGVADYILKDRMDRLPYAVLRAVEFRGLRLEHELTERSLRRSEAQFRTVVDSMPMAVFIEDGTSCRYANHAAKKITGYGCQELLSKSFWELLVPSSRETVLDETIKRFGANEPSRPYEVQIVTKQRQTKRLHLTVRMITLGDGLAAMITAVVAPDLSRGKHLSQAAPEAALIQYELA